MNMNVEREVQGPSQGMLSEADEMLATAATALKEYVDMLQAAKAAAGAGDVVAAPKATDLRAEIRNYAAAYRTAMAERNKVGSVRTQTVRTVGDRTLDLDAARAEVGRRLACLRNGGSG
ncbi:MAG: hypothetical protein MUD11_04925 [Rhodobacteraceae bacterium]|jgi:hypothetical protein|nr:hypothetical protein [Paracoccaceae bacterium]